MIDVSETKNEVRYTKIVAVEACRLVETGRTIRAEAYHYEKSVYIKMTNSVGILESKDAAGRLKSKKGDTKNHGLGLEKMSFIQSKLKTCGGEGMLETRKRVMYQPEHIRHLVQQMQKVCQSVSIPVIQFICAK